VLDASGMHVWSNRFGDAADQVADAVAVAGNGSVFLSGAFDGTIDLGGTPLTNSGERDLFVAGFNPTGTHQWSSGFGNESCCLGDSSLAVDAANTLILTGNMGGVVDFGGGPLTSPEGLGDVFVAAFTNMGAHQWSSNYSAAGHDSGSGVATDLEGNVVISGWFAGTIDFGGGPLVTGFSSNPDVFLAKLVGIDGVAMESQTRATTARLMSTHLRPTQMPQHWTMALSRQAKT
jgi:hypothetical protein